jgi:hypothetical protein
MTEVIISLASPLGKVALLGLIVMGPFICALIQSSNASRSQEALHSLEEPVQRTQAFRSAEKYFSRRVPLLRSDDNAQARIAFVNSMGFMTALLAVLFTPILFPDLLAQVWTTPNYLLAGPFLSLSGSESTKIAQYQATTMAIAALAISAAYVRLLFDIVVRFNTDQFGAMQVIFSITRLAAAPLVAMLARHLLYFALATDSPADAALAAATTARADEMILLTSALVAVLAGVQPDVWLSRLVVFASRLLERMPPTSWLVAAHQAEPKAETLPEAKPLTLLIGMGVDHRDKLMEVDINECQRLAASNPLVTWARTSLSLLDVLELCDRAILAIAFDAASLQVLRSQGITGALQLEGLDDKARSVLAGLIGQSPDLFAARITALLESPVVLELRELVQAVRAGLKAGN